MSRSLAPVVVISLLVLALQLTICSALRVNGVVFMLVWLWPVCVGLTGNSALAIVAALVGGVGFDTHAATPFGLTALTGLVLAIGASRLGREGVGDLDSAAWWVAPLIGAAGGFAAPFVFVVGGFVYLNFSLWRGSVLAMMVTNATLALVFMRPLSRLAFVAVGRQHRVRR